jgi:AraC-like DNA-binding protein
VTTIGRFPSVSFDTILSAYRQQAMRVIKETISEHRGAAFAGYVERWNAGETIAEVAAAVGASPYLLARQFVELLCGVDKKGIGKLMKSLGEIGDERLRREVRLLQNFVTLLVVVSFAFSV